MKHHQAIFINIYIFNLSLKFQQRTFSRQVSEHFISSMLSSEDESESEGEPEDRPEFNARKQWKISTRKVVHYNKFLGTVSASAYRRRWM